MTTSMFMVAVLIATKSVKPWDAFITFAPCAEESAFLNDENIQRCTKKIELIELRPNYSK